MNQLKWERLQEGVSSNVHSAILRTLEPEDVHRVQYRGDRLEIGFTGSEVVRNENQIMDRLHRIHIHLPLTET